jgi:hypothetical protein
MLIPVVLDFLGIVLIANDGNPDSGPADFLGYRFPAARVSWLWTRTTLLPPIPILVRRLGASSALD